MKTRQLLLTAIAICGFAVISMAQVPSYVPSNGLVGWYPFTGNANDLSGSGNNGTVNGAILTTDRFGDANRAYFFNGNQENIYVANSILPATVTSYSISVWIKPNAITSGMDLLCDRNTSTYSQKYRLLVNTTTPGIYNYIYTTVNGPSVSNVISSVPANNNWQLLVAILDASANIMKFYLNGSLIGQSTNGYQYPNHLNGTYIGANVSPIGPDPSFNGSIDDIGVWNRVLTQQEITNLYNSCQLSVTTQPINQSVSVTSNAQFKAGSSDIASTFQWQTDLGLGFQNINNAGQYSGATNDTLTVSTTTLSNNNQQFRCIITSGLCKDTSNVAVLTVINDIGIQDFSKGQSFSVYPNPAKSQINVRADANLLGSIYSVFDNSGKSVLTGKILSENTIIELGNLSEGIYLFRIGDNLKQTFKVLKQ